MCIFTSDMCEYMYTYTVPSPACVCVDELVLLVLTCVVCCVEKPPRRDATGRSGQTPRPPGERLLWVGVYRRRHGGTFLCATAFITHMSVRG